VLVLPANWPHKTAFLKAVETALASSAPRPLYYPGAAARLAEFQHGTTGSAAPQPVTTNQCIVVPFKAGANRTAERFEVFAPALAVTELPGDEAEAFLISAIDYANQSLAGTLGANILIHPQTLRRIGRRRFDEIIAKLRYGTIAINAWTGLGFLLPQATWGAFPGHTLPRNLLSLSFTLLPRPPWFITNRRANVLGRLLTHFAYHPSLAKLARIFANALVG